MSVFELNIALVKLKNGKASVPDLITYEMPKARRLLVPPSSCSLTTSYIYSLRKVNLLTLPNTVSDQTIGPPIILFILKTIINVAGVVLIGFVIASYVSESIRLHLFVYDLFIPIAPRTRLFVPARAGTYTVMVL